ncbi:MAG: hypothetical protein HZA88_04850 [Verrucomicrobia bacterium]|nr:hypothetical protein [Verrucomicrobiota bacterium]
MGLTIHYSLRAKGTEAKARKLITALHQAAHDLPFKEIGDIVDLSGEACDFNLRDRKDPLHWLLCQALGSVHLKDTHTMPDGVMGSSSVSVVPTHIIAFTAWPGDGCEESNIGLCHYPSEIVHPRFGTLKTKLSGWQWSSFCKTQYASNPDCGGVANFLRCHLAVIALLDKAKEVGCLEEVSDEGKFWDNRIVEALVKEIGSWNQMLAALGGKLKDMVGDGIVSAIHEFPNFEQLEAAGQNQLPPQINELAQLIKQVSKATPA